MLPRLRSANARCLPGRINGVGWVRIIHSHTDILTHRCLHQKDPDFVFLHLATWNHTWTDDVRCGLSRSPQRCLCGSGRSHVGFIAQSSGLNTISIPRTTSDTIPCKYAQPWSYPFPARKRLLTSVLCIFENQSVVYNTCIQIQCLAFFVTS